MPLSHHPEILICLVQDEAHLLGCPQGHTELDVTVNTHTHTHTQSLLTAFPLLMHFLTPLISNCLNLPFGTQEQAVSEAAAFSLQNQTGYTKTYIWEGPTGSSLVLVLLRMFKQVSLKARSCKSIADLCQCMAKTTTIL